MSEWKTTYHYVSVKTGKRIFADEVVKYRLLEQMDEETFDRNLRIAGFCILDDRFDVLLVAEEEQLLLGQKYEPAQIAGCREETAVYRAGGKEGEKAVCQVGGKGREEADGLKTDLIERLTGEIYTDYQRFSYGDVDPVRDISIEYRSFHSPVEALRCVSCIHMLPLEAGIVDRLKDYWWSSYQHYRGSTEWPFMNVEPILSQFRGGREDPWMKFVRYQLRQTKDHKMRGKRA
ncbi:MAG: hypothetical protein Q4B59_01650 [Lachnospiraceae bacterium]|nr:hypothetical protein [Lachnospiraceae bacterium]